MLDSRIGEKLLVGELHGRVAAGELVEDPVLELEISEPAQGHLGVERHVTSAVGPQASPPALHRRGEPLGDQLRQEVATQPNDAQLGVP